MRYLVATSILSFALSSALAAEAPRPNVVLIVADDLGYGSVGCYGADPKLVRTPNIDRLAAEGRRFTDANTTSSVCSPTRYSVLTGRYCWRTSLKQEVLGTFAPLHIEPTRLTLASLLKARGYATAAVGKWHLGYGRADDSPDWRTDYTAELSPGPLDVGFDYHFGVPSNHGDTTGVFVENRFVYGLRSGKIPPGTKLPRPAADDDHFQPTYDSADLDDKRAKKIVDVDAPRRKNTRVMAELTDKATGWIEQQPKDKPFFLYFTPVGVHHPITPDADLAGKSPAGLYGDWIAELDRSVGRILDTLDRQGVAQNTLVLFTSDNGGVFVLNRTDRLETTAINAGLKVNGALRGGKHDVWEGGFKVPLLVRWPGHVPAGSTTGALVSLVDILATTAEIVGAPLPPMSEAAEDSRSFLPALVGKSDEARDDVIVHSAAGAFAVRQGRWKWVEGIPSDEASEAALRARATQHRPQLYDTVADPAETTDVTSAHPEVVRQLSALLDRYRDGGYSRELPPPGTKRVVPVAELPTLDGPLLLDAPLDQLPVKPWSMPLGEWKPRDGGLWGFQRHEDKHGANLHVPIDMTDGTIEYRIAFDRANRHSLRIERPEGSFRIEISRTAVGLTKNPTKGEGPEAMVPLARKRLELEPKVWYPVRITLRGDEATVQVNDVVLVGKHPVIGLPKKSLSFLVFGQTAGFRDVKVGK